MNLQMIDHIEKILSPSPEYDLQLLKQAGFITEAGSPNLPFINLEVALFVRPFANSLHTHGLSLLDVHHAFQRLFNDSRYMEVYLLLLYIILQANLQFYIPAFPHDCRPETTPPVTKIYFVILHPPKQKLHKKEEGVHLGALIPDERLRSTTA